MKSIDQIINGLSNFYYKAHYSQYDCAFYCGENEEVKFSIAIRLHNDKILVYKPELFIEIKDLMGLNGIFKVFLDYKVLGIKFTSEQLLEYTMTYWS